EPLRTLARHRRAGQDLLFGQYLIPDGTGVIPAPAADGPLRIDLRATVIELRLLRGMLAAQHCTDMGAQKRST
ncbi:hypothetical protein AB0915_09570, partial [Streptomyces sp. NPDC048411]